MRNTRRAVLIVVVLSLLTIGVSAPATARGCGEEVAFTAVGDFTEFDPGEVQVDGSKLHVRGRAWRTTSPRALLVIVPSIARGTRSTTRSTSKRRWGSSGPPGSQKTRRGSVGSTSAPSPVSSLRRASHSRAAASDGVTACSSSCGRRAIVLVRSCG